jgi:hypothetical protein
MLKEWKNMWGTLKYKMLICVNVSFSKMPPNFLPFFSVIPRDYLVGTCPVSPKNNLKKKIHLLLHCLMPSIVGNIEIKPTLHRLDSSNARNLENYLLFFNLSNFKTIGRKFSKILQEVSLSNQNIKASSNVIILIFCL